MKVEKPIISENYRAFEQVVSSEEFIFLLNQGLLLLGRKNVRKNYRHLWSEENPSFGYCYVITELLYHLSDRVATPKTIATSEGKHWYIELPDGTTLDYAKDNIYDYSQGKKSSFMTVQMSARARKLKDLMGL